MKIEEGVFVFFIMGHKYDFGLVIEKEQACNPFFTVRDSGGTSRLVDGNNIIVPLIEIPEKNRNLSSEEICRIYCRGIIHALAGGLFTSITNQRKTLADAITRLSTVSDFLASSRVIDRG